jgi:hypothetical protein
MVGSAAIDAVWALFEEWAGAVVHAWDIGALRDDQPSATDSILWVMLDTREATA